MIVFALGITLVSPNVVALIGFALLVTTIELQVRVVEEPYLRSVHSDAYRRCYLASVGRFVPALGRIDLETAVRAATPRDHALSAA